MTHSKTKTRALRKEARRALRYPNADKSVPVDAQEFMELLDYTKLLIDTVERLFAERNHNTELLLDTVERLIEERDHPLDFSKDNVHALAPSVAS